MITNFEGKSIDLFNLKKEDIHIQDIITALPNICRYGGRVEFFYSVGQHSVELSRYLRSIGKDYLSPIALLHDGLEAYVGDVVYPIKEAFPEFLLFEERINKIIFSKYNIDLSLYKEFSYYDRNIVVNEMKALNIWEREKDKCKNLICLPNLEISQFWYPELARINFKRELLVVFPNILF